MRARRLVLVTRCARRHTAKMRRRPHVARAVARACRLTNCKVRRARERVRACSPRGAAWGCDAPSGRLEEQRLQQQLQEGRDHCEGPEREQASRRIDAIIDTCKCAHEQTVRKVLRRGALEQRAK
eukprot:5670681-Pleurochrysis_carterae.AAC.2